MLGFDIQSMLCFCLWFFLRKIYKTFEPKWGTVYVPRVETITIFSAPANVYKKNSDMPKISFWNGSTGCLTVWYLLYKMFWALQRCRLFQKVATILQYFKFCGDICPILYKGLPNLYYIYYLLKCKKFNVLLNDVALSYT